MKYRIVEATTDYLKNIEFDFDFSKFKVGDEVNVLGNTITLSQLGGGVVGGSNTNFVLFAQEIPPIIDLDDD